MAQRQTIKIGDKTLPCYPTMGAMVRYRQMTGEEVTSIGNDISQVGKYLYCSVAAACSREEIDFDMDFLKFADSIDIEDLNGWAKSLTGAGDSKKKPAAKK